MGNIINRVFESAGPDSKVRGTPQQVIEKYQALARDAQVSGDRVAAESYLQHAEHYSRLLGDAMRQQQEARQSQERDDQQPRSDNQQGRPEGQQWSDGPRGDSFQDSHDNDNRGEARRNNDNRNNDNRNNDNRDNRDNDRRDGDSYGQNDRGRDSRDQRRPHATSEASGLTTIDPLDASEDAGPVETPESRRSGTDTAQDTARDTVGPAATESGSGQPDAAPAQDETPAPPAKRPRTRRRAKPEAGTETPAAAE